MMGSVWGVVSGSYSDYRVHAIYDSEDAAKRAAEHANRLRGSDWERFEIEGFPFNATPRLRREGGWTDVDFTEDEHADETGQPSPQITIGGVAYGLTLVESDGMLRPRLTPLHDTPTTPNVDAG